MDLQWVNVYTHKSGTVNLLRVPNVSSHDETDRNERLIQTIHIENGNKKKRS